ncbi:hypothetical protein OURE66S_00568 [Oligella ureolytica]
MKKDKVDNLALLAINQVADLNLTQERINAFKETYAQWIDAANELNRKMSQEEYRELTPMTVLQHDDKVYE